MENTNDLIAHISPLQATSQTFADVFTESPHAYLTVKALIDRFDYASLPGWVLLLSRDGFTRKIGQAVDEQSDVDFFERLGPEITDSDDLPNIAVQLTKLLFSHISNSYGCTYMTLLQQGQQPLMPQNEN
ncbi:MAG: hypothetical protein H7249_07700 [Chitinophagaceae bacterium]|nr:hypothetical protein [Oligoflexus sp.]